MRIQEVARAFDELADAGKVRNFGVSNHTPAQIELLKRYVRQPLVTNWYEPYRAAGHLVP
jgi:predicted oxidoreductase